MLYQKTNSALRSKELPNGVQILVLPLERASYVAVTVGVGVGSRHDPPNTSGMAHLLEHLLMTRTTNRPRTSILFKDLDALGGASNGWTDKDNTCFTVNAVREDARTAVEILFDVAKHSLWNRDEFRAERDVVVAELKGYEDEPERRNLELLERTLFEEGGLGHSRSGDARAVSAISNRAAKEFRDTYYCGSNIVVCVAGAISFKDAFEFTAPLFSEFDTGVHASNEHFSSVQSEPRIVASEKHLQQIQFALGFPMGPMTAKEILTLDVITSVLGDGAWSSLFFSKIRSPGLVYDIGSDSEVFQDAGSFTIWGSVGREHDKEVLRKTLTIVKNLKARVSPKLFRFFKDYNCKRIVLNDESPSWCAQDCFEECLRKRTILTPAEQIKVTQEITEKEFLAMMRRVFDFSRTNLALLGPCRSTNVY